MLLEDECDGNLQRLRNAMNSMKDHNFTNRLVGINLYFEVIQLKYQLISLDDLKQLQIIFECENNSDVLLELSRLCMKIALVSLLKESSFEINIILNRGEVDLDYLRAVIRDEKVMNAQDTNNKLKSYDLINIKSLFECIKNTLDVVIMLVPILQDIAEVDDVVIRSETLKSLKLLMNIITFMIEDYIGKKTGILENEKDPNLISIFNQSIDIFEKLSTSDIISHKILSCHIIPLILRQKRLYNYFDDERNILITNYTDFCTHPAPILRKHASNVLNYIMDEIEFDEEIINVLFFPMIKNFCFDEQDCVRLSSISNVESFFFQTVELFGKNDINSIFSHYNMLQPLLLRLCNDESWRIRSSITMCLINIFVNLIRFEEIMKRKSNELKIDSSELENTEIISNYEKISKSEFLDVKTTSNIVMGEPQIDNSFINESQYIKGNNQPFVYEKTLLSLLNQLITDPEGETRSNSISAILQVIENNYNNSDIIDKTIHNILFHKVIIPRIDNKSLLIDSNTHLKIHLARVVVIIMKIYKLVDIENNNWFIGDKISASLKLLLDNLIDDSDTQVRQNVLLSLHVGMMEWRNQDFMVNVIMPYLTSTIKDNSWRIRYCSLILLLVSFYVILECNFEKEDIWSGRISEIVPIESVDNLLKSDGVPNTLLDLIFGALSDKTSIIRQVVCIFAIPMISFWLGHKWTKKLWERLIFPLITDNNSYLSRSVGLLSANSIILGARIRSFEEFKQSIQLISQLIFNLLPSVEYKTNKECMDSTFYAINHGYCNNLQTKTENDMIDKLVPKNIGLEASVEFLSKYIPLIRISNLVLSCEPFIEVGFEKRKSFQEDEEFHYEIISAISQYSVNDPVANVRIKAFQVIHSFICINGLENCDKSIVDQVLYSHENDPDLEVRNYCLGILKRDIEY
ncbi:protein phosphatase regulator [Cryptosporidium ryanae]|uniref:protein phosphatase regulator n=1 Tax=Cryptosporidium ryanae TaxID=515981 RepID=UPI00351A9080|nr:protein phosphatase regulator [Cryptosporidium ryanae]